MAPPISLNNANSVAALIAFTNSSSSCYFDTPMWTGRISGIASSPAPSSAVANDAKKSAQALLRAEWEKMGVKELDDARDAVKRLYTQEQGLKFAEYSSAALAFMMLFTGLPDVTANLFRTNSCPKSGACHPYDKDSSAWSSAIVEAFKRPESDSSAASVLRDTFKARRGGKLCKKCNERSKMQLRTDKGRLPLFLAVQNVPWHDDYFKPTRVEFDVCSKTRVAYKKKYTVQSLILQLANIHFVAVVFCDHGTAVFYDEMRSRRQVIPKSEVGQRIKDMKTNRSALLEVVIFKDVEKTKTEAVELEDEDCGHTNL